MDQILNANDTSLAKSLLNDGVVTDGDSLLVNLGVSALVDKLADSLKVGVSPGNVRGDDLEHAECGLVELNKHSVIDLAETEELQDFTGLGGKLVDTGTGVSSYCNKLKLSCVPLDADNKGELGLGRYVKVSGLLGEATKTNLLALHLTVLFDVSLSALEDHATLVLANLSVDGVRMCVGRVQ